jgi:hypothetical protein
MSLERVILNWPTALDLKDEAGAAPRSVIQVAKTGSFVSKRYGKFSITREDLAQILHNFNNVTPKAPTLLPVDWDHLSMQESARPGDGAAAGWMKRLELRDGGDTLWAEVEWTPKGAEAIKNREYQFVSPSFVKDHTHKDGRKIGTTLLAAAITNHPFLEGMQALTLHTPAIAGIHLSAALRDLVAAEDGVSLSATVGQRVTVSPQHVRNPRHAGTTFEVVKVDDMVAGYDDARVWLTDLTTGEGIGWYAESELEPARAQNRDPSTPEKSEDDPMKPEERIMMRATAIAAERQINLSAAVKLASAEDEAVSREYLQHPEPTAEPSHVVSLRRHDGEGFAELVGRVQRERRIDLRSAIRVVGENYPALAAGYESGESL